VSGTLSNEGATKIVVDPKGPLIIISFFGGEVNNERPRRAWGKRDSGVEGRLSFLIQIPRKNNPQRFERVHPGNLGLKPVPRYSGGPQHETPAFVFVARAPTGQSRCPDRPEALARRGETRQLEP